MATAAIHPTDQMLQAYGLGKLDDASSASVSQHLEGCDSCQSRVAEISSDDFLGRLRDAGIKPGSPVSAPVVSSLAGLSMLEPGVSPASPLPAGTLPPGLADHPDYEVIRELGQGGMGTVYLAKNRLMGRHEVLKVVSSHMMNRRGVLDRFLVEIRNAARLHHTNIVTAYSASRVGESIIFAMEFVDGLDLAKLIKAKGALPVANACNYVHQAALGLQHADEQSMVHRDIKPSNLMLAKQGNRPVIKVLDFGLAKVRSEGAVETGLTHEGQMLGTPDFIAPEQIGDAKRADIRADIYSLGCTLYYLLTGSPPFHATSLYEILQAHHSMDALPLNLARPEVPVELAALVARMMAKEPQRRFQTPADVAQALAPFFKKASANVLPIKTEISQFGHSVPRTEAPVRANVLTQPATNRAAAAAPPAQKPAVPATPEARWESLIEFKETQRPTKPTRAAKMPVTQKPRWLWPTAVAALLLMGVIVVLAAGVLRVKTPDGTMVIENVPVDAVVEVDGERVVVTPVDGKPIEIQLKPGKHGVIVKRDNAVLMGESVTIESGKDVELIVRRDEEVKPRSAPSESNAAPRRTDESLPSTTDRTKFTILSGTWTESGAELIQTDTKRWYNELLFGDEQWTDYDFTVDAMRVGGGGSFSLFFRSTGPGNEFDYTIAGDGNKTCYLQARERPLSSTLKSYGFTLRDGAWYTARVHVRGNHVFCSIFDSHNTTETRVFDVHDDRHPRGRVGLQTFGASFRFKNIKVTSPDGKVLWQGLPAIAPTAASEVSTPVDPAKRPVDGRGGFIQLFNGTDLTGWKTHPRQQGNWHVEDGILVGSGPAAVSHLYTIRNDYKDFHLRVEARINDIGNSGVYFRAPFGPSWPATGPKFPISYEAQIYSKPGDRNYTGSLYAGSETVVTVNVRPVLPFEWFTLEVIARGDHLVVKVNDRTTAEYTDVKRLFSSGHIAVQQNGPETVVEFRKIEIKDLSPSLPVGISKTQETAPKDLEAKAPRPGAGFTPLFNGKDIAGWTAWGTRGRLSHAEAAGIWWVRDGVLHGTGGLSHFFSPRGDYKNVRIRAEAMINDGGNSGLFFRVAEGPGYITAYEAQINSTHRDPNKTGSLYRVPQSPIQVAPSPVPPDTWFTLEAEALGNRIRVWVDGKQYVDWVDADWTYSHGHIAIQAHHPGSHVQIRKLEIMELDQAGKPIVSDAGSTGGGPSPGTAGRAGPKRAARGAGRRFPADAKEFHGKFYKPFPNQLSWHEARSRCLQLGGHLAVVKSEEENQFLMSLMKSQGVNVAWLGATDENLEGSWVWVDGEPLRYSNWNPGQPNNKQGLEHYMIMISGNSVAISRGVQDGKWHDQPNNPVQWSPGFICQWD